MKEDDAKKGDLVGSLFIKFSVVKLLMLKILPKLCLNKWLIFGFSKTSKAYISFQSVHKIILLHCLLVHSKSNKSPLIIYDILDFF